MEAQFPRLWNGPSILDVVRQHIDASGHLDGASFSLPDDDTAPQDGVGWSPGAADGVTVHHTSGADDGALSHVPWATHLLVSASCNPSVDALKSLHAELVRVSPIGYVDELLTSVCDAEPNWEGLGRIARWLIVTSPNRRAVKVGIALLGIVGLNDADVPTMWQLALHEEFTLFAAVALARNSEKPDEIVWELAQQVHGWGRIHCVELLGEATDPRIKDWVLRQGYRNDILIDYTALIATKIGDLAEVLRNNPDREQLTAAGEILTALLTEGPAEGIEAYPDGEDAVSLFLEHLMSEEGTLEDFAAVEAISDFLVAGSAWAIKARSHWSTARCQALAQFASAFLARDHWRDLVLAGLRSDDHHQFALADSAAAELGIDTFEAHVTRIRRNPMGSGWLRAWSQADELRAEELVHLARTLLPLDEISRDEWSSESGVGSPAQRALDQTVMALRMYPGVGADLLMTGLESSLPHNRAVALATLSSWPYEVWPNTARQALARVAERDPDLTNRPRAQKLLDRISARSEYN